MKNLREITLPELEVMLVAAGEPKFRAKQVHDWVWQKHAADINDMTNLSKALREKLSQEYFIPKVRMHHSQYSSDGTIKNRLQLHDGYYVKAY